MEKLIELLNEYSKIRNNARIVEWVEHTKGNLYWEYWENAWSYMVVISKEYGFIEWLVENDKIDIENLQCVFSGNINKWKTLMEETDGYERYEGTEYETTESLIMLLSISDTPIEDLISYLK